MSIYEKIASGAYENKLRYPSRTPGNGIVKDAEYLKARELYRQESKDLEHQFKADLFEDEGVDDPRVRTSDLKCAIETVTLLKRVEIRGDDAEPMLKAMSWLWDLIKRLDHVDGIGERFVSYDFRGTPSSTPANSGPACFSESAPECCTDETNATACQAPNPSMCNRSTW